MKAAYKELRKKLQDSYTPDGRDYRVNSSIGQWVRYSGIKPTLKHTNIICTIFGSVPYVYQPKDRKVILDYLKKHKYKEFKNEKLTK